MKNLIYLILLSSLLGCQSNTPIDKPTPVQNKDTIIENPNSPIPILNTDTTDKQKQTTTQTETRTIPKKKVPQKTVPLKKHELGNDLLILEKYYYFCNRAKIRFYTIKMHKNSNVKLKFAYCEGYKQYIGRKDWENQINYPEPNERVVGIGIPFTQEEIDASGGGKSSALSVLSPPPIPYSGKMLIEYEINGKTKYQSIPAADFKQDTNQSESRGC